jgi:regulator of cell morphogenesis and NO signaling
VNPAFPSPFAERQLGDLVTDNPRAAAVLDGFGLDYCCRGHQTLAEAAGRKGVPIGDVSSALAALDTPAGDDRRTEQLELDELAHHIVEKHHRYVREVSPAIERWLAKLVDRHGDHHSELMDVQTVFIELSNELHGHMYKEEQMLFPFISDLARAQRAGTGLPRAPFGTVRSPVRVMEHDHQFAGDLLARIRDLTNNYTPPDDACRTYRLCYAELETYENDLKRHIHLENNVLFPKAIEMEGSLG